MTKNRCRVCRWWSPTLRHRHLGVCKNAEVRSYVTSTDGSFRTDEDFVCGQFERCQSWSTRAAQEIEDHMQGLYGKLPVTADERVQRFAEVILKHADTDHD